MRLQKCFCHNDQFEVHVHSLSLSTLVKVGKSQQVFLPWPHPQKRTKPIALNGLT
jgi:hypothetical protein